MNDHIEHQGGGRFSPDKDFLGKFYPAPVAAQPLARLLVQVLQLSLREHFLLNRNTAVCGSAVRRGCHVLFVIIGAIPIPVWHSPTIIVGPAHILLRIFAYNKTLNKCHHKYKVGLHRLKRKNESTIWGCDRASNGSVRVREAAAGPRALLASLCVWRRCLHSSLHPHRRWQPQGEHHLAGIKLKNLFKHGYILTFQGGNECS